MNDFADAATEDTAAEGGSETVYTEFPPFTLGTSVTGTVTVTGPEDPFPRLQYTVSLVDGHTYIFMVNGPLQGTSTFSGVTSPATLNPQIAIVNGGPTNNPFLSLGTPFDTYGIFSSYTAIETGPQTLAVSPIGRFRHSGGTGPVTVGAIEVAPLSTQSFDPVANYIVSGSGTTQRWAPGSTLTYNIEGLSSTVQALAERALQAWGEATSLAFTRATTGGQIVYQNTSGFETAALTFGGTDAQGYRTITGATVSFSTLPSSDPFVFDSSHYQALLRQTGHALGLGNSSPYDRLPFASGSGGLLQDSFSVSVMSRFSQTDTAHGDFRNVLGLQPADLLAAQTLYGADAAGTRTGNTVYGFNSTETDVNNWAQFSGTDLRPPAYTIYDTGGLDTINLSGYAADQDLNLNPETYSSLGFRSATNTAYLNVVSIARGTIIENAVGGSGHDFITANSANNTLTGGAGRDRFILNANGGNDTITDFSVADDLIDISALSLAQRQAVIASVRNVGGNTVIDLPGGTLTLTGVVAATVTAASFGTSLLGTHGGDTLFGTASDDRILGYRGSDVLSGFAGADNIEGGDGDDTLIGGDGGDTLQGGNGRDVLWGGAGTNQLIGGSGNDVLVSESATDTLDGGDGGDIYILNTGAGTVSDTGTSDAAILAFNALDDLVYSYDNLTLGFGIEIGVMFGPGTQLTGNGLNNLLIGNTLDNTILGGVGFDTIYGVAGTNTLDGGDGDDILVSGTGIDTLIGGSGNNTYIIDANDIVIEAGGIADFDRVWLRSGSYVLPDTIEQLISVTSGPSNSLAGNALNNYIYGDVGNNRLIGLGGTDNLLGGAGNDFIAGGTGLDTLQGNTGADTFAWSAVNELGDIIQDWIDAEDQFHFVASAFGFAAGATLVAGVNFISSTAPGAVAAGPAFLWDSDDTALYFDADGNGGGAAVLVADLQAFTNVTVADFVFAASAEEPDGKAPDAEAVFRDEVNWDALPVDDAVWTTSDSLLLSWAEILS